MSNDERRLLQLAVAGKSSLAEFTHEDAKALIEELKRRGAKPRRARPRLRRAMKLPDNVVQFINPKQRRARSKS